MKRVSYRQIGMAMLLSASISGPAFAAAPEPKINPAELQAMLKLRQGQPTITGKISPSAPNAKVAAATVVGWNFKVCVQNFAATDGTNFGIFALNSDGSGFFAVSGNLQTSFQAELLAACQHAGSGYFVHVINSAGTFDAIAINYP